MRASLLDDEATGEVRHSRSGAGSAIGLTDVTVGGRNTLSRRQSTMLQREQDVLSKYMARARTQGAGLPPSELKQRRRPPLSLSRKPSVRRRKRLKSAGMDVSEFNILSVLKLRDPDQQLTWRRRVYELLEGQARYSLQFQLFILLVIIINISVFVMASIPEYGETNLSATSLFYTIETVSVLIFTVELAARVWSIVEQDESPVHRNFVSYTGWLGRLRFMCTWLVLFDILSILPWYIELFLDTSNLPIGTPLRIFRVFRLIKTEHYFHALDSVGRVIFKNRDMLLVGAVVSVILVLFTSTVLYYEWGDVDPENFGSIPACMVSCISIWICLYVCMFRIGLVVCYSHPMTAYIPTQQTNKQTKSSSSFCRC
jgi:hypothetical protein